MTPYPKRLIEVDLPIARISTHARAEKESRVGHIPRLHIYPAARPLAACRAVILASLWPDPVDLSKWEKEADAKGEVRAPRGEALNAGEGIVVLPGRFLEAARTRMNKWAQIGLHKASPESYKLMVQTRKNPNLLNEPERLREALLNFIADFANWDNSADADYLSIARDLVDAAHQALGGIDGSKTVLADPFAGGGAIPLEASRCGCESVATDLNPLSIMINSVLLEHVPKQGDLLINEVERWIKWVVPMARTKLEQYFPNHSDGAIPVAYLWSRVVVSDAPGEAIPSEIPMLKTMWLAKQPNRKRALRWVRDKAGVVQTDQVRIEYADGIIRTLLRPRLEVFTPSSPAEVGPGTLQRGSVTCPVSGYTTPVKRVREQLRARRGGSSDARLYCVVVDGPNGRSRDFRTPHESDLLAVASAVQAYQSLLALPDGDRSLSIPTEPTPLGGGRGAGRAFSQRLYGMDTFADLFAPRQVIAIATFVELTKEYVSALRAKNNALAEAVEALLSLVIDRLADLNASLCLWQLNTANTAHVFGRWVLQIAWDFGEVNPLAGAGGSPESAVKRMTDCLRELIKANLLQGSVVQSSANRHPWPDDSVDAVVTDPPYYDAVPYSDLLDFFFVWLKRVVTGPRASMFIEAVGPKIDECIVDDAKKKDDKYFESMMTECLGEARRIVRPEGVGVVVFAHKTTQGWEKLLQSIIDAGWAVTGSWPIDTEMGSRLRAKGSAALASSVHLVCRPREALGRGKRAAGAGEWREVLSELPQVIATWMPRLADEGVVGADAIFACLGPALEIFSRHSRVEKASGQAVTLPEYLEHVWAAVSNEALSMIFKDADAAGFEPDARLTAMWLWTLGGGKPQASGEGEDGDDAESDDDEETTTKKGGKVAGFVLEYDAARKIAQGLGIHLEKSDSIVEVKGESARLLPVSERTRHLFGKDAEEDTAKTRKAKKKAKQGSLFEELDAIEAEAASTGGRFGGLEGAKPGATVLDKVHQAMILFAAGRGEALKRFLVEDGVGKDGRFWKLAQSLSALYPTGTDEKRWVDGVLARKKGLGF